MSTRVGQILKKAKFLISQPKKVGLKIHQNVCKGWALFKNYCYSDFKMFSNIAHPNFFFNASLSLLVAVMTAIFKTEREPLPGIIAFKVFLLK